MKSNKLLKKSIQYKSIQYDWVLTLYDDEQGFKPKVNQ